MSFLNARNEFDRMIEVPPFSVVTGNGCGVEYFQQLQNQVMQSGAPMPTASCGPQRFGILPFASATLTASTNSMAMSITSQVDFSVGALVISGAIADQLAISSIKNGPDELLMGTGSVPASLFATNQGNAPYGGFPLDGCRLSRGGTFSVTVDNLAAAAVTWRAALIGYRLS